MNQPAQRVVHLTQDVVKKARPLADAKRPSGLRHETFFWDDQLKGFGLRITDRGFKSFFWQGRIKGGRERRLTLKPAYPLLSVAAARQQVIEIKHRVARGEDPALERQLERGAPSFEELWKSYRQEAEAHGRDARSLARDAYRFEAIRWHKRQAADISRADVLRLHAAIGAARGKVVANRTLALLRVIYNRAADRELIPQGMNPAARVKPFQETKRERFLSPDEFKRISDALAKEPNPSGALISRCC